MLMRRAVCVGEGYIEEFEVKDGVHQAQDSARCSLSLCLKPCHASSALGSPWRTAMLMLCPCSVLLEWAATASSATVASTGCTRTAVGSSP